jgi:hypothetical protein
VKLARLHSQANTEPYWHVHIAILVAVGLQFILNDKLTVGPRYFIAVFEVLLLAALALFSTRNHRPIRHLRRTLAFVLIALISAANFVSLGLVLNELFRGRQVSGKQLIISALAIYLTNVIIFGIWYWELDSTGAENQSTTKPVDFLFPQFSSSDTVPSFLNWRPTFTDYLYTSVTNATAFSPTDTLPLTHRAKMLMTVQSMASLITVVLVIARAANIV